MKSTLFMFILFLINKLKHVFVCIFFDDTIVYFAGYQQLYRK